MKRFNFFILVLVLFFVAGSIYYFSNPTSPSVVQVIPTPVTTGIVLSGTSGIYPNPTLTPGSVFPRVTAAEVCVSGYSSSVRDVPVSEKRQVYQEYGLSYPQTSGAYEADHFIPLELGGDNSLTNLWPEPAEPAPGFHEKDRVENFLHDQVCNHDMSLSEAQLKIRTDWYAVYQSLPTP